MMRIEDTINDVVLIVVDNVEPLQQAGIGSPKFYARVVGYDEFGLWIEHPNFELVVSEDEKGKPLPPDKVKRERIDASVYLQWRNIATLVHFPHREGFDFPSPFHLDIGFKPDQMEESKRGEET